jgi:hypothetical protein
MNAALRLWQCVLLLCLPAGAEPPPSPARQTISLNGQWLFQTNGAPAAQWKTVTVPSYWESHEGTNFEGIGWYRRAVAPLPLPPGRRALLHFQAAATAAEVWWNGQRLGAHLGGWTPFRFEVAPRGQANGGSTNEILVRLDEKVGHSTQGFLPVLQPHFGGLWQDARLLVVPDTYIDDLRVRATGNPRTSRIELEVPLLGAAPETITNLTVRWRRRGQSTWSVSNFTSRAELAAQQSAAGCPGLRRRDDCLLAEVAIPEPALWSPPAPSLYELDIELPGAGEGASNGDAVRVAAAFRSIEACGTQLRLNGQPLSVRGVLNWGYYPPSLAPNPGDDVFRRDLEFVRACGFNLMKFCLWVPPQRFLELADELGVLTWMEYPTWHPQLTPQHQEALRQEFGEFFYYDRNHPSVILRSLTCETGQGADLGVIQSLYDQAHAMIPGALVEDDSSWIEWNRVCDFYDDHPYGNNHTWAPTLRRLNDYILAHGPKPLVLGEAISADTWIPREPFAALAGKELPYWFPTGFAGQNRWLERLRSIAGPGGLTKLVPDSLNYGMLMRKYQVEVFRREVPCGGYVVSELRDVPVAPMGLLNDWHGPKWPTEAWAWQGDTVCLLKTEDDRRSFSAGGQFNGELLLSHFGPAALTNATLVVTLEKPGHAARVLARAQKDGWSQNPGTLAKVLDLAFALPTSAQPRQLIVRASLTAARGRWQNEWPVWVVPPAEHAQPSNLWVHSSLPGDVVRELFPGGKPLRAVRTDGVVVAARFDGQLAQVLERGGRVLLLPDGGPHSLPLKAHWFLRGGPYVSGHPLTQAVPRELLVELQHFDLGSDVVADVGYLENIDPILMLWDIHAEPEVKTHGLIFATGAAKGRLMVSAVRHRGHTNAAGKWLLCQLLAQLANGPAPSHALSPRQWARLKQRLGTVGPASEGDILK